jgi:hypothetical protein
MRGNTLKASKRTDARLLVGRQSLSSRELMTVPFRKHKYHVRNGRSATHRRIEEPVLQGRKHDDDGSIYGKTRRESSALSCMRERVGKRMQRETHKRIVSRPTAVDKSKSNICKMRW